MAGKRASYSRKTGVSPVGLRAGGRLYRESRALFRALGDKGGIARALHAEAYVPWNRGEDERATALGEESLALFRELEDKRGIINLLYFLAFVAVQQGIGHG